MVEMGKSNWIKRARQRAYQRKHCPELVQELTYLKMAKKVQERELKTALQKNDKLETDNKIKAEKIKELSKANFYLEDSLKRRSEQLFDNLGCPNTNNAINKLVG